MRKILTVGMESQHFGFSGLALSMEEADVVMSEAQNDAGEIEKDLDESDRLLTVSQSLEDMAEIVESSGTDEVDPVSASLVNVATDLAVAGTDVAPDELVPEPELRSGDENVAVESRRYRIATESIATTARTMLDSVIEYVKKIWKQITDFFYKIFGAIPSLRRKIESIRDVVDAAGSKSLESDHKKFKLTGMASLEVDGKVATGYGDVSKGFSALHDAAKYVFGDYISQTSKAGTSIKKAMEEFDKDKAAEAVSSLRQAFSKSSFNVPGMSGDAKRKPDFETKLGTPLLGGKSLMASFYKATDKDGDLGKLEKIRRNGVELVSSKEKKTDLPKEVEFSTMSTREMNSLLDDAEKILDVLEAHRKGAKGKELEKTQKEIESVTKRASKSVESSDDRAMLNNFRAVAGFNVAFARWAFNPSVPMTNYALTEVRTVLALVQKSCSQYK